MDNLMIPERLAVLPFYDSVYLPWEEKENSEEDFFCYPFFAEILWHNNRLSSPPWDNSFSFVPELYKRWEMEKDKISEYIAERRRKEARPLIIKHSAYLLSAVWWTSRKGVPSATAGDLGIETLGIRKFPANMEDRMSFILKAPDHHHSFIQLLEMFKEQKKQFAVIKAKEKREKSEGKT